MGFGYFVSWAYSADEGQMYVNEHEYSIDDFIQGKYNEDPEFIKCSTMEIYFFQKIIEIPKELNNLTNLIELTLYDNPNLNKIPKIDQLKKLEKFILVHSSVTELPDLDDLTNLKHLEVQYNYNLEKLPELSKLVNLKQLRLKGNSLSELPEGLSKLVNLEFLNLRHNRIGKLPDIYNLTQLKYLNLSDNNLDVLHDDIAKLKDTEIHVEGNYLGSLPITITEENFPNIHFISKHKYKKNNPLKNFPYGYTHWLSENPSEENENILGRIKNDLHIKDAPKPAVFDWYAAYTMPTLPSKMANKVYGKEALGDEEFKKDIEDSVKAQQAADNKKYPGQTTYSELPPELVLKITSYLDKKPNVNGNNKKGGKKTKKSRMRYKRKSRKGKKRHKL
jgi:hypothetical protein